jgi:hypothetical protein
MRALKQRLTYANVMATIAVLLALGVGTVYAAGKLNGKQIKKGSIPGNRLKPHSVTGKQVNSSTLGTVPAAQTANSLAPPEAVHEVGAPGEPPFEGGDLNAGTGFASVGFYKDRECVVHLTGTLDASPGVTAFTLPAADRPAETALAAIAAKVGASAHPGYVMVQNTGQVQPSSDAPGEYFFGLDGVTFRAASC